jgi:hypothetical protein
VEGNCMKMINVKTIVKFPLSVFLIVLPDSVLYIIHPGINFKKYSTLKDNVGFSIFKWETNKKKKMWKCWDLFCAVVWFYCSKLLRIYNLI